MSVEGKVKSKIDRLTIISNKRCIKQMRPICCRYLAKSRVYNCKAQRIDISYANFRGSQFSDVKFEECTIWGCDFYGTIFSKCSFDQSVFTACNFVSCVFKNCSVNQSTIKDSTIVTTSVHGSFIIQNDRIMSQFPKCEIDYDLYCALESLHGDMNLRKHKLLFLGENKYNDLTISLMQQKYGLSLSRRLFNLSNCSTRNITTIKKLENILSKL